MAALDLPTIQDARENLIPSLAKAVLVHTKYEGAVEIHLYEQSKGRGHFFFGFGIPSLPDLPEAACLEHAAPYIADDMAELFRTRSSYRGEIDVIFNDERCADGDHAFAITFFVADRREKAFVRTKMVDVHVHGPDCEHGT